MLFAQVKSEVTKTDKEESVQQTDTKGPTRKVTRLVQVNKATTKTKYDAKGGAIVPEANKGIDVSKPSSAKDSSTKKSINQKTQKNTPAPDSENIDRNTSTKKKERK